jgi:hypothetical protein
MPGGAAADGDEGPALPTGGPALSIFGAAPDPVGPKAGKYTNACEQSHIG